MKSTARGLDGTVSSCYNGPDMSSKKVSNIGVVPLANNVVIEPLSREAKTKSGIFIPDTAAEEKPDQGVIVAVGPGKREDGKVRPMSVKPGQVVIFSKYSPDEITVKGTKYYVISEDHILAVIK